MKILVDIAADPAALAALRRRTDCVVDCIEPPEERPRGLPVERIRDADICFCTFPPDNHALMSRLRWIQIGSTGYTQIAGIGLPERGIRATNARGCFDVAIGEWNIAMMINLARNGRQMFLNQEAAIWDRAAIFQNEIHGATLGLWGYGGIGRETARLAKAFGMKIHVQTRGGIPPRDLTYAVPGTGDPSGALPDRVFRAGEELEFLSGLDFLVLAMPLTLATEGRIGERELRALPPRAFVLNPARGPIIQEAALLRALAEKWIAGAALDTHYHYPMPPDHPLWRMPGVIFTPHISGSSQNPRFKTRLWDIFTQNLDRFLAGKPLLNELTPAQLNGA